LLHRLRDERKLTLLIVTHSHDVARAADRRIPMKDGQIQPD
jgi:ABC-type lipoprotein export system ATPase subunit